MAVEDLGDSHPEDSQNLEIPTENLMIQGSNQDEGDLGKGGEAQDGAQDEARERAAQDLETQDKAQEDCLLYTSPSPRDRG